VSLQSVPAVILASIVIFIGTHDLSVFFRRPKYNEHLTFFLTCLAIGFYDICCAFLYSAPSWVDGASWQRMQLVATALLCAVMPWFLFNFYADVLPVSRSAKTITATLSGFFLLAATAIVLNPGRLFWPGNQPLVKTIRLPLGLRVVYNEVQLGPLADLMNLLAVALVVILAVVIFRAFFRARRRGIVPLAVVVILILLCLLSDTLIARGALQFVYTSEYALMGLAMLIAQSLSRKVVDAGRTREALRESEARYRDIFQHSAVPLWMEDISELRTMLRVLQCGGACDLAAYLKNNPDFVRKAVHCIQVIDVNDAAIRLYEAEAKEDLLGPLDRTLDADALAHFAESILAIAQGKGAYENESTARTLRGKRLNLLVSTYIARETDVNSGMLVSVLDITARKKAEEKLRSFIEQSTEAIFLVDEDGRVVEFNSSAEKLSGISRSEALGMRAVNLIARSYPSEGRTPRLAQRLEALYREAMENGQADFLNRPITGTLQRPDGTRRDFVQFVFPIRTSAGIMLGSISHDTTETRKIEEALRVSEERLRQAQKMEAIGTLAGGIAHDFNNLLTGILGHSSLLLDELPADSPLAADVAAIEASAQRASELARQILTFSRQDPRIEMGPVNPKTVVDEVVRLLQRTVDKSVAIEARSSCAQLRVLANAGQLHQAILNLCINACEAMPRGGKLLIETGQEDDRATITVTDSGIGMGEALQKRIFEPFFTTKEQGRGLGLPMVFGIVRGHGGDITVQSEPGKGTTFRALLPLIDEQPVVPAKDKEQPRGGRETVLVIDDEPYVRRLLTRILERAGYTVLVAEDGARGLSVFEQSRGAVDLVVLDVSMPGMSGAEVHERLVALAPDVKIVLSSGYSDDERISRILARGVRTFLRKPYRADAVLRAVREALDGQVAHA
jgi:PAS domain S-box-containing protein